MPAALNKKTVTIIRKKEKGSFISATEWSVAAEQY
jgi:hypothetical protein